MRRTDIDDAATEDIDQLANLSAPAVFRADLNQHQVAFDKVGTRKVLHFDNRDDLAQLLTNLIQCFFVTIDHKRDAGKIRIFRGTDCKAVNVVRTGCQHTGNVRQHAGLIYDQGRQNVFHIKSLSKNPP